MIRRRLALGALTVFAAATLGLGNIARGADEPPVTIPVILPLTGGGAFIGATQRRSLEMLEAYVNRGGGIKGRPLKFAFNDDQTSPQVAVQLASSLAKQSPIVVGSSLSAMCKAIAPIFKDGPVQYCLSPAIYPAKGAYTFSTSASTKDLQVAGIRYFRERGLKKIALLATTDSSGQDGVDDINEALKRPENADMKLVATERFAPSDQSVTAQLSRIKAAQPQALIVWVPGTPFATALRGIQDVGLDVPVESTSANMIKAQLTQYSAFIPKELYFGGITYAAGLAENPKVKEQQANFDGWLKANNVEKDLQTGMAWDAGLIITDALRHLGPNAKPEDIKNFIEGLHDFPGIVGMYDFREFTQRGVGVKEVVMMRWQAGSGWSTASKYGGALK